MMAGKRRDLYQYFKAAVPPQAHAEAVRAIQLRMIADLTDLLKPRRRRPPGTAAAPIPADPRKPNTLSGGAAAALDFE